MTSPSSNSAFHPRQPDTLELRLCGDWTLNSPTPSPEELLRHLNRPDSIRRVHFDATALGRWDSFLLIFLSAFKAACRARSIELDCGGLPEGVRGLLELAAAVPEQPESQPSVEPRGFQANLGRKTLKLLDESARLVEFIGATVLAFGRLVRGHARFPGRDLMQLMREVGPDALAIVGLISLLVGMILAFVGAVQLRVFGAQLFIADLVGLGMSREMGAMMTAIILAGRTGAAYAAQLGAMQTNDEIDALQTFGFRPMEFLVLPRVIALTAMTPFLCVYADCCGILGGAMVSSAMFDVSFGQYFSQLEFRLHLADFNVGVGKSAVFGFLVAVAGCMRGLDCARRSSAVGAAATSAVVTSIVFIVVSDAIMTLVITAIKIQ